jgi:hypothetical protein
MASREIPFNKQGLRSFAKLNDAVKYYGERKISQRKVVNAFQEAHELNLYNRSINMVLVKKSKPSEATKRIAEILFNGKPNETQLKKLTQSVNQWYGTTDSRVVTPPVVKDPLPEEKQPIDPISKTAEN